MRLKFIANPVAGRGAKSKVAKVVERLRWDGHAVDLYWTSVAGDAQAAAREAAQGPYDRVLAGGGDGTLNEVFNGLAGSSMPLAFIPLGTTNVLALELGLPREPVAAGKLAVEGIPTPVCNGKVGDHRFLLMAGIGFDAEAVRLVDLGLKRRAGKLAYVISALQAWWKNGDRPILLQDETGRLRTGFGAIVCKSRCYGGRFVVTPGASLFSDRLDICLILRPGRWTLLRLALDIALGRVPGPPWAEQLQACTLQVSGAKAPVQVDGDYLGETPVCLSVEADAVRLILPRPAPSTGGPPLGVVGP